MWQETNMANKNSAVTLALMCVSFTLIALVSYAILSPEPQQFGKQTSNLKDELKTELGYIESRLAQQIAQLEKNSYNKQEVATDPQLKKALTELNDQMQLALQRQEQYQKRLALLEKRLNQSEKQTAHFKELSSPMFREGNINAAAATSIQTESVYGESIPRYMDTESPEREDIVVNQIAVQISKFEEALFQEQTDEVWFSQIRGKITRVMQQNQELAGIHVEESRCGHTLCKLNIYVEEGESVEEKVQLLMMSRPWTGESFVNFGFDGHGEIFFAREGAELP